MLVKKHTEQWVLDKVCLKITFYKILIPSMWLLDIMIIDYLTMNWDLNYATYYLY